MPTKVKLDKDELDELKSPEHRKSARLEPLGFKLGANGGGGGIRTPVPFQANGFQDRLVMTASIHLRKLPKKQNDYNKKKVYLSSRLYTKNP